MNFEDQQTKPCGHEARALITSFEAFAKVCFKSTTFFSTLLTSLLLSCVAILTSILSDSFHFANLISTFTSPLARNFTRSSGTQFSSLHPYYQIRCSVLRSQHSYLLKWQCSSNQPMHSSRLLIFDCPLRQHGCSKRFRSQAGRTHHIRTIHTISNIVTQPQTPHSPGCEPISPPPLILNDNNQPSPPPLDLNADISQSPSPSLAECASPFPGQPNQRYHPWLTGEQIFNSISSGFY